MKINFERLLKGSQQIQDYIQKSNKFVLYFQVLVLGNAFTLEQRLQLADQQVQGSSSLHNLLIHNKGEQIPDTFIVKGCPNAHFFKAFIKDKKRKFQPFLPRNTIMGSLRSYVFLAFTQAEKNQALHWCGHKPAQDLRFCNIRFVALTCFHLTICFGKEKFSWLPSKDKVADENLYFQRHTNFLVKLQCSAFSSVTLCVQKAAS